MTKSKKNEPADGPGETVPVVAAVVTRDGRVLLAQRPEGKRHAGLWEFPGGKLLAGESMLDGAHRELSEELGLVATAIGSELYQARDPGSPFRIHFVEVETLGDPVANEHPAIGWFTPEEAGRLPLAPADARFVREAWGEGEGVDP